MSHYLYILKSLKDSNHYIGISTNVEKRLQQHNAGKTFSTKSRRPFILLYKEVYTTRQEARAREKYLKSYAGAHEKKNILESL